MRSVIATGLGFLAVATCSTAAQAGKGGTETADGARKRPFVLAQEELRPPIGYEWFNAAALSNGAQADDDVHARSSRNAVDGRIGTYWVSASSDRPRHFEVSFVRNYPISRIVICPRQDSQELEYQKDYTLQCMVGSDWKDIEVEDARVSPDHRRATFTFRPVDTGGIRLRLLGTGASGPCRLTELEAYALIPGAIQLGSAGYMTEKEMATLPHGLIGTPFRIDKGWKFTKGDSPDYAGTAFDDSAWHSRITTCYAKKDDNWWGWYRVTFELPGGWEEKNLVLDIGELSSYDETYLNGKRVATYGDPNALIDKKYYLHRRYPLPAGALRRGRNVLAVRVRVKSACVFGTYTWPALQEYRPIFGRLAMKNGGGDAVKTLLTTAEHLNRYRSGDEMAVKPVLFSFHGGELRGKVTLVVFDAEDREVLTEQAPARCFDRAGNVEQIIRFPAPQVLGAYRAELRFVTDDETLWRKDVKFHVCSDLSFAVPADTSINRYAPEEFPVEVSRYAVGAYGPNRIDFEKRVLYHNEMHFNGGLSFSMRTDSESAPLIFACNVRPSPRDAPVRNEDLSQYEGYDDAWFLGYVTPGGKRDTFSFEVSQASWSGRTYTFAYPDGVRMDFAITNTSPAYRVRTDARQLKVFDQLADWDAGLPASIAYEGKDGVRIVPAGTGLEGGDMVANWVLVHFNGARNWTEFDIPFLLVLEKRPTEVKTGDGALVLDFPLGAGTVQGMPLYGVSLLPPARTAGWGEALPEDVAARCRFWSKVLVAAPTEIVRTARIDYDNDEVIVRDRFKRLDIRDDWNTKATELTFLPPTFPLASGSGNIKMAVANPVRDLHYATLHGPLLAAENGDEQRTRISGLLRFVREVRVVEPAQTPQADGLRTKLNTLIAKDWERELCEHPWQDGRGVSQPGRFEPDYTNLLLALPHLDQELRDQVVAEIRKETETYLFFKDKPERKWADKVRAEYAELPQIVALLNPQTGLMLAASPGHICGTDVACWESLRLYMAWSYAWHLDQHDFVRQHYELLTELFNLIRNAHDWAVSVSWDVFGGMRTGNGLQEPPIMHAGSVAMARLARRFGDQQVFEQASYHAVLQLVGIQAALATSEYLRSCRPWSCGISSAAEIERMQALLPRYYAEANEFAGFHQMIINGSYLALNEGSYIMTPLPEVMRPYKDLWGDFSDEFYNCEQEYEVRNRRRIGYIHFDKLFYQANRYPVPLADLMKDRLPRSASWRWKHGIASYRSMLDYLGGVKYERLW